MMKISSYPKRFIVFLCCGLLVTSCAYKDRVAPINLPDAANSITVDDGLKISAQAFVDPKEAKGAFGFDARKAGLLPVQLTFLNDGSKPVRVEPEQTFLVDRNNQAWQVASLERTYERTRGQVEVGDTLAGAAKPGLLLGAAGAVAGLAVGIVTGENIGEAMGKGAAIGGAAGAAVGGATRYDQAQKKIRNDLADKRLRNDDILPGQIAYGVLFFPGMPEEAQGVKELRLALAFGDERRIVRIAFD